jgi:altronate dehydratase small subunit
MKGRAEAIIIDEKDNVAVALETLPVGRTVAVEIGGRVERIELVSEIPMGHKFAVRGVAAGAPIVKYGQPIGQSMVPIARGEHVHVHNTTSQSRGGRR